MNRSSALGVSVASVSHAQEHRATLLRRAARARRAMGETSYTRGAGGARESVGSAEARVRPSPRPSSALAARARATGNIGFVVTATAATAAACRRNTMVKQRGPTLNPSELLVPNVLLSVVIRVLVYHRHAGQLRGAYSVGSAPRHVCPRPPSRRLVRAATLGLRARAARA